MALAIVLNAKTQRTSVCNAAESLLVHADVAEEFLPRVVAALQDAGVTIHGDAAFAAYDGVVAGHRRRLRRASTSRLDISAAVVPDLDAALAHIRRYSTGHTEAIVTERPGRGPAVRRRGRRGGGAGQRLDPVHRRRRVRLRRRDRDLHPEAARPRPDGAARDDLDQVRRHRRRPRPLSVGRRCLSRCRLAAAMISRARRSTTGSSGGIVLAILLLALLGAAGRSAPDASTAERRVTGP